MGKKIISLGPNCETSITLRNMGLRNASYPWDWARYTNVEDITRVIENEAGFRVEDWDKINNIHHFLPHDTPGDTHGAHENLYENSDTTEKYRRRFARFFQDIKDEETYLIRFGDGTGIERIRELLPNCHVLHLPNGQADSIETRAAIGAFVGENDDYSKIMIALSYLKNTEVPYPTTPEYIKKIIIEKNDEINSGYLNKLIDQATLDSVFETNVDYWSDISEIFENVKKNVKNLTGNEYALL